MSSRPPLGRRRQSGDGEEISATVTKSCLLKSGGRKNLIDTYGLSVIFLPLDETIASRAVFVIVSGSDGGTGGRKRFWNQLNNLQLITSEITRAIDWAHPRPPTPP